MRFYVRTLGCKANLYDSQQIEAEFGRKGWVPAESEADADVVVVNSCTVTDEADRQSRRAASGAKRRNAEARVIYTGCGAEVRPGLATEIKGIDWVIGNADKLGFVERVLEARESAAPRGVLGSVKDYGELRSRHPMDREWPVPESAFTSAPLLASGALRGESARTRAFLKIQEGCNSFCTFCIIPYGRGPARSLRPGSVVAQVRELVAQGVREIVFTGTNLGDYGCDWGAKPPLAFVELCETVLKSTDLERLRLSSLDPTEIPRELTELMAREPRLMPHFHVSLQSPHSRVLKAMKRRYGLSETEECLRRIGAMSFAEGTPFVGMDVIAGFPGETLQEFEESVAALERLPWSRMHVFPYSEREGTPATRLELVPVPERKRRARVLQDLSFKRLQARYQSVAGLDRVEGVLVEGQVRGPDGRTDWWAGYSPAYHRFVFRAREGASLANQHVSLRPHELWQDRRAGDVSVIAAH